MLLLLVACEPAPPTYDEVQAVYDGACAFSTCHGSGSPAQGLELSPDVSYASTVGVPSTLEPSFNLIEPGDAGASYLYLKASGAGFAKGESMPPDAPLDAERLAILEAWIDAGAVK